MSETSLSNKVKQKKRRLIFFIFVGVLLAAGLAVSLIFYGKDAKKDPGERKRLINASDITFLCLPDTAAMESVSLVENENQVQFSKVAGAFA